MLNKLRFKLLLIVLFFSIAQISYTNNDNKENKYISFVSKNLPLKKFIVGSSLGLLAYLLYKKEYFSYFVAKYYCYRLGNRSAIILE